MKAVVLNAFGGPEVLSLQEVDKPTPGTHEVLVKVHATSVNPADMGVRSGMFGPMVELPTRLGYDVSGVLEAVGEGVEGWSVGDEVYYAVEIMGGMGANAEYSVTHASKLARKPKNLSHQEAAAVPVAGGTAYAALFTSADLRLGQRVLIHGAAGGVGHFAVQLAQAAGAYVFATCGAYDAELVRSLGADRVIDYRREDFKAVVNRETDGEGVDVAFDAAGGKLGAQSLAVTRMGGQVVTVTGVQGDLNPATRKNITVRFVHLEDAKEKLDKLRTLIEWGRVKPVIGAKYRLEALADAHVRLAQGGEALHGKVVIEVV